MFFEAALVFIVLVLAHYWFNRPKGMPPGPFVIPFLGSGIPMSAQRVKEYQKKYGDIFRCEIGSIKQVYICDYKILKETLGKSELADRPILEGFHMMTDGVESGVIFSNGQRWLNIRRFLLRNLRDLGMGRSSLAESIVHEAKLLVEDFKTYDGKPTKIPDSVNIAVLNVIWQMVASRRYDLRDQKTTEFLNLLRDLNENNAGFFVLEVFPLLKKILPDIVKGKVFGVEAVKKVLDACREYFVHIIGSRRAVMDQNQSENVIDEYLVNMDQKTDISEFFSDADLTKTCFDVFAAGFDTTSNTIRWMILYAAKYPKIQQRVQKQIDEVLGSDFPSYEYKTQLPLVEAFIHEVLRISSLVPFGVWRKVTKDFNLAGYLIPQGTWINGMSGLCHKDERYWKDNEDFSLERFLDDAGVFVAPKEGFVPFGSGKRVCLGEGLAKMELSIFTTALLQRFTFSPPEGQEVDLTPADLPFVHLSRPQEILITSRK